jgi:hypothetical protein
MSHREYLIVIAHTHQCTRCRARLLDEPEAALGGRGLTSDERSALGGLAVEHFLTPDSLARATGVSLEELERFGDEPVVRLRHL